MLNEGRVIEQDGHVTYAGSLPAGNASHPAWRDFFLTGNKVAPGPSFKRTTIDTINFGTLNTCH